MKKLAIPTIVALMLTGIPPAAHAGTPTVPTPDAHRAAVSSQAALPSKWTKWKPTPTPDFPLSNACAVVVDIHAVKDHVEQRTRLDAGGNTETQSRGRLVLELTPASKPGSHYRFDVSGPSVGKNTQIAFKNGDFLYRATGSSLSPFFGTTVDNTGLPRLAYTKGLIAVLYTQGNIHGDVINRPSKVLDVCKRMGVDSAP